MIVGRRQSQRDSYSAFSDPIAEKLIHHVKVQTVPWHNSLAYLRIMHLACGMERTKSSIPYLKAILRIAQSPLNPAATVLYELSRFPAPAGSISIFDPSTVAVRR